MSPLKRVDVIHIDIGAFQLDTAVAGREIAHDATGKEAVVETKKRIGRLDITTLAVQGYIVEIELGFTADKAMVLTKLEPPLSLSR